MPQTERENGSGKFTEVLFSCFPLVLDMANLTLDFGGEKEMVEERPLLNAVLPRQTHLGHDDAWWSVRVHAKLLKVRRWERRVHFHSPARWRFVSSLKETR